MKYIDEYRDGHTARRLSQSIHNEVDKQQDYYFMEFCGGHTHAIHRYGVTDLLPDNIHLVHGPGCPVCVLPMNRIDAAIELANRSEVILCSYGDMLRVPGSHQTSLLKAKAQGADIRMVYSTMDALNIALENPKRSVIFFAIGFETTAPATAAVISRAKKLGLANFTVFNNHVLTPSAIQNILESPDVRDIGKVRIDGFIGPAHVSTIIGSDPYRFFAAEYHKPVVIAGFEPLDVMLAIHMLVKQVNEGRADVENEFTRAVTDIGNMKAKNLVADVFELRRLFEWRGLGVLPYSALRIKQNYRYFDAEERFDIQAEDWSDHKSCECASVLRGVTRPMECKLFGTVCTPETPVGPCMVSAEGACSAYYTYGRFRKLNPSVASS